MGNHFNTQLFFMKYLLALIITVSILPCFGQTLRNNDTSESKVDSSKTSKVEMESEFPGGLKAWQQFLQENLVYPKKAVRKKIEGTVILQFIVGKDGTPTNVEAISGPDILKEEALRAFSHSPNWIPAFQYGRKVKSYKKQPIIFKLEP
jgi:protein TonB